LAVSFTALLFGAGLCLVIGNKVVEEPASFVLTAFTPSKPVDPCYKFRIVVLTTSNY